MKRSLVWAVALTLASFGAATAQETTTGSISGRVLDPQGSAVPGATATITSGQGAKHFVSDANGRFFAPFLVPGEHSIRVELSGFSAVEQKGVTVRLGQRLELTFTLTISSIQEVIEVVSSAPVVDVTSTTAGGILDSDQLQRLPVGRNFTQTLYLVPGVSDSSGVGNANPSIGGASGLENNYVVDGVNISSQGFGGVGVYSIVYGSLGTGVTTDFIKETQVKVAGFEAEYGQATGGVVNVVTRSGTNQFHGSVFGYYGDKASDYTDVQTPNGTVNTLTNKNADFGLTLGAPLLKNRLFFFGAFNPQYQNRGFIAPADQGNFPLRALGEVERKRRTLSYAAKLTWQATPNHRFDASVFGDPSHGDLGPQAFGSLKNQSTDGFSELDFYGGDNQSLRYDGIITDRWLIEASVSRAKTDFRELPSVDEWNVQDRTVTPFVTTGGGGFYEQGLPGQNLQYSLKSTHLFEAAGSHQFRYGVQYEDIEYTRLINRTGPTFRLSNGTQTRTGGQVRILAAPELASGRYYSVIRANFGAEPKTTQQYLNWFAQDTWEVTDRLTLKPGIRWERQTLVGGIPICFDDEQRVGDGGSGNGNAINCEYTWTNNWSPRIGAIFDVRGDGKSKIYANYGRFYAKIPNDLAARALSADAGITRADYFDAGLTQPIPDGTLVGGLTNHLLIAGLSPALFENDTKSTYHDEFLAGFEFEVVRNLNFGVRYIHRNLSTVLEDYAQASPVQYDLGFPGLSSVEYIIDNISADLVTLDGTSAGIPRSSFEKPQHVYDSIEVTANKSFADDWSLVASYRWSKLKGNFEGFFRSDNGQSDPAITSLYDFPTNDPSYTQIGAPQFGYLGDIRFQGSTLGSAPLPNNRTHQLKLYGTWTRGAFNLGGGLNAGSGRILTALAANPTYGNAGEIPLTLRGGGVTTLNGFLENTKAEVTLDLHADYSIRINDSQRVMLLADMFNVFNRQNPLWYDVDLESSLGVLNPNFGQPTNGGSSNTSGFEAPRSFRFGARFEW